MQIDTNIIRPDILADIIVNLLDHKSPNEKVIIELKTELHRQVGDQDQRYLAAAHAEEYQVKETPYGTDPRESGGALPR